MLKLQFRDQPGTLVKLSRPAITLGRDASNDVVIDSPSVSDFHAEINADSQHISIVDLVSASGTYVNEHRISSRRELKAWDVIRLGTVELEVIDPGARRPEDWVLSIESDLFASQFYTLQNKTVVGRDPGCDLTIDSRLLSRRHAELTVEGDHLRVVDLGSVNGTFINGERVQEGIARSGDELRFDQERFIVLGPNKGEAAAGRGEEEGTILRESLPEATVFAAAEPGTASKPDVASHALSGETADRPTTDPASAALLPAQSESQPTVTPGSQSGQTPESSPTDAGKAARASDLKQESCSASEPVEDATADTAIDTEEETQVFTPPPPAAALLPLDVAAGQAPLRLPGESCLVGRSEECDVVLADKSVSKRHAQFLGTAGQWSIKDLGSSNGVWVNGEKVGEARLKRGDQLKLGRLVFEFTAEEEGTGDSEPATMVYRTSPARQDIRQHKDKPVKSLTPRRLLWALGAVVAVLVAACATWWSMHFR